MRFWQSLSRNFFDKFHVCLIPGENRELVLANPSGNLGTGLTIRHQPPLPLFFCQHFESQVIRQRWVVPLPQWQEDMAAGSRPLLRRQASQILVNKAVASTMSTLSTIRRYKAIMWHVIKWPDKSWRWWTRKLDFCRHHWMTKPKFWPKPIPRLVFRYQIFRNRNRDFFPQPNFPKPRLFFWNRNQYFLC